MAVGGGGVRCHALTSITVKDGGGVCSRSGCLTFHEAGGANDGDGPARTERKERCQRMIHPGRHDRRLIYGRAPRRRSTESFPPISYFNSFLQVMAPGWEPIILSVFLLSVSLPDLTAGQLTGDRRRRLR